MTHRYRRALVAACWTFLACAQALAGGEFAVSPLRVDLGPKARSAAVTVTNEGKEKVNFQLQAMEWTQDAAGKDQYAETQDLIFFPKILSVEPGQEGIIRVGLKTGPAAVERSYRLFIEELPGLVKPPPGSSAHINVLIRFGLPIFSAPIKPEDGIAIETLELKKGVVSFAARNTGNRRQVVRGLHLRGADASGEAVYSLDLADRYILAGVVKPYTTTLTGAQCQKIAVLAIEMKTDNLSDMRKLDVDRAMCP